MEEKVIVRYDKSHVAKLSLLSDKMKMYYELVKNHILSYQKVKLSSSWDKERFYKGRVNLVYLTVRGKTIKVYLALDYESLENKNGVIDASDVKKYQATPTLLKLKGPRSYNRVINLIDEVMAKNEIEYEDDFEESYADLVRSRTLEELLEEELIVPVYGKPGSNFTGAPLTLSLEEDDEDDEEEELEEELVLTKGEAIKSGYLKENIARSLRTYINLDVLESEFNANEVVDLDSLKNKGLIKEDILYVKVLGNGTLTKALSVRLNDFSKEAYNKITSI